MNEVLKDRLGNDIQIGNIVCVPYRKDDNGTTKNYLKDCLVVDISVDKNVVIVQYSNAIKAGFESENVVVMKKKNEHIRDELIQSIENGIIKIECGAEKLFEILRGC